MGRFLIPVLLVLSVGVVSQVGTPGGNSACAQWCATNFPNNPGSCTSQAAHGTGPCYVCGPRKPSGSTKNLCSGVCTDTSTDSNNCGSCMNKCRNTESCEGGQCRPKSNCANPSMCGTVNCGICNGNTCNTDTTACHSGVDNPSAGYCVFRALCSQVLDTCASNKDCPEHNVCVQTCCTGGDFTPGTGTPRCIPEIFLQCPCA
ncbi:hypothetical protein ASPWEDRAFT_39525 [Aspergillus wentii DTO 134E9]|uniref:TNFR-Cys domain-containing protein n=1 Tax=Aspergillus wentii DTO 134E9 TaxID=1073089 RepID=A0A1L9RSD2_ASPWE|nr:uncharacterized protein ASPWEDRAFT_39525 [Aspergillus wentii DTO 134E9]OJJ37783.1 hypothetical protein ASPWEDRAFT_39525 [Aspergillus wentii DTO 134E9]